MKRIMVRTLAFASVLAIGLSLVPSSASAATLIRSRTLVVSEAPPENLYLAGTDVTVTVPLPADVLAAGGTLTLSAPVAGDAFLAGGSIQATRPVSGDLRAAGAHVEVLAPVSGDLMLAGETVTASSTARDTLIAGGTVKLTGSGGAVTVYGADVMLSGEFKGDVKVVASDTLTLAEGTKIHGTLRYNAPQEVAIPVDAVVDEGVTYTGSASYLPTTEEAKTFALAGASVLFVVRIVALLIAAALVAGLFPVLSLTVADRTLSRTPGKFVLLALLGFAVVIATPVLALLLLVSFVGAGVSLLIGIAYLLLLILGYLYAGIVAGAALSRGLLKRPEVTWKTALLGMLALCLIRVIPIFGGLVAGILFLVSTGALVSIAYRFAFGTRHDELLESDSSEHAAA